MPLNREKAMKRDMMECSAGTYGKAVVVVKEALHVGTD